MIKLLLPWKLNYIQKRSFIPQIVFMILKLKKSCNLIFREYFPTYLRRRFSQNIRFLQNHKDNYSASCKPKYSTSMEQSFCQLQKVILVTMFEAFSPKLAFFLHHFFILKKPETCMRYDKNSVSCFWEKVVLINWLNAWQWRFQKAFFA